MRQPHQQRVIDEKRELDDRAQKLSTFIGVSPIFENLDPEEQERMKVQNDLMWQLSEVLGERIAAFPEPTEPEPEPTAPEPAVEPPFDLFDLRRQIALSVSGYIEATDVARGLLADVKAALAGGVAHSRSRLELALTRYQKRYNKLTLCPEMPSIKTDVRLFDLVRYMRSELHQANLITDAEFAWLLQANPGEPSQDGSPSRERLESYDELRARLEEAESRLKDQKGMDLVPKLNIRCECRGEVVTGVTKQ